MKASRLPLAILSLGIVLTYFGCKKSGPGETIQEKQSGLLSQTWTVQSVSLSGSGDQTSNWSGDVLTIAATKVSDTSTYSFSWSGRPKLSCWESSGKWSFGADPVTQLIRNPNSENLPITYTVTAKSGTTPATLQLNFTYSGNGFTRVSNVAGQWTFTFTSN